MLPVAKRLESSGGLKETCLSLAAPEVVEHKLQPKGCERWLSPPEGAVQQILSFRHLDGKRSEN